MRHIRRYQQQDFQPEKIKYLFLLIYGLTFIIFGFIIDRPLDIYTGLHKIIVHPDVLVADYIVIGGMGAAFVNSGLLTLIAVTLLFKLKIPVTGPAISAIGLVSGFAFFGKNIFNIWFILLGVYLYAKYQKDRLSKYIIIGLFSTALSPIVTQFIFNWDQPLLIRLLVGSSFGILIGLVMPPLGTYMLRVHQGFNLYNIGFTAGIVGTVTVSVLRSFGLNIKNNSIWYSDGNVFLGLFLAVLFGIMILMGVLIDKKAFKKLGNIYRHAGRLITDFTIRDGYGPTLINMGINGFVGMGFVLLVGGSFNGPIIGGLFTIVGFSALGKHLKNITPILLGVYLASLVKIWNVDTPSIILAALFGTTLAPIAGEFGWKYGVLAGFLHSSVVINVGVLHGGLNLYNNGFAGGIVAMFLLPLIEAFRKDEM